MLARFQQTLALAKPISSNGFEPLRMLMTAGGGKPIGLSLTVLGTHPVLPSSDSPRCFYSIFPNGGGFADAATCLDILEGEAVVNEFRQVVDIAFDAARRTTYELGGLVPQFAEVPLEVHAGYSREEILAALGFASQQRTPSTMREGVAWCEAVNADAFLITLKKSDRDYSPTTMYRDYALNPQLFQWESQSTSSSNTRTGQRYIRGGRHSACKPLGSRVDVHIDHGERSSSGLPSHFGALRCARNGYLVGKLLADFDRQFGSRLIANLGVGPRHGMGR